MHEIGMYIFLFDKIACDYTKKRNEAPPAPRRLFLTRFHRHIISGGIYNFFNDNSRSFLFLLKKSIKNLI